LGGDDTQTVTVGRPVARRTEVNDNPRWRAGAQTRQRVLDAAESRPRGGTIDLIGWPAGFGTHTSEMVGRLDEEIAVTPHVGCISLGAARG
jgi:hypothetical protein